jgi:hypothetical protein
MIRNLVARFTLVVLVATACSGGPEPAPSSSASIAEAQAKAEDLANSTQSYQPVRFVSAIEQVRPPKPVNRRVVADVVKKGTDSVDVETVATPAPVTTPDEPEVAPDSTIVESSAPRVPTIVPRSAPTPEAVGGGGSGLGEWRGRDPGPDMGTVIGVVLRGGRVDPGHCPRHPHPSQIPNRLPNR